MMDATRDHSFEIVGAETLECELNGVRAAAAGSLAGISGGRTLLRSRSRAAASTRPPWVAAAIEQHSDTCADPIARFHRTFRVVSASSSEMFPINSAGECATR
jgi:hypothetical protein